MKTRRIPFIKMNGAGNDFVFLSRQETKVAVTPALTRKLLDRNFGVGGDQLIVYTPGTPARPHALRFYNSDGSYAEMCGNGARAAAFYLREFKNQRKDFVFKTDSGPRAVSVSQKDIEVDMAEPIFEGRKIPVKMKGPVKNKSLKVAGKTFKIHAVSMGNPHCVIFVKNVEKFPVREIGPLIERHPFFPKKVNVEFVQIVSKNHVKARVWERGAGETLACGTGACAIAAASARAGKTSRNVKIDLPGGRLTARWEKNNRIYLSGPAEVNYSGLFLF